MDCSAFGSQQEEKNVVIFVKDYRTCRDIADSSTSGKTDKKEAGQQKQQQCRQPQTQSGSMGLHIKDFLSLHNGRNVSECNKHQISQQWHREMLPAEEMHSWSNGHRREKSRRRRKWSKTRASEMKPVHGWVSQDGTVTWQGLRERQFW